MQNSLHAYIESDSNADRQRKVAVVKPTQSLHKAYTKPTQSLHNSYIGFPQNVNPKPGKSPFSPFF